MKISRRTRKQRRGAEVLVFDSPCGQFTVRRDVLRVLRRHPQFKATAMGQRTDGPRL